MPGAAPFIQIREANEDDASALDRLWPHTRGTDLQRCRVWIAERGEQIVACASAQLVELALAGKSHSFAELWTGVSEPRLAKTDLASPLAAALRAGLTQAGVQGLYRLRSGPPDPLGIELPHTHPYTLRTKLVRPLSARAKRARWSARAVAVAAPFDKLVGLPIRGRGWRARTLPLASSWVELSLDEDGSALAQLCARSSPARVGPRWRAEDLAARHLPGDRVLGLTRTGVIVAFVSYRVRTQASGLRVGELLDICARDDAPEFAAQLLRAAERRLRSERVDALTLLDGYGERWRRLASKAGYVDSGERLQLEFGPLAPDRPLDPALRELGSSWRLGLLDRSPS